MATLAYGYEGGGENLSGPGETDLEWMEQVRKSWRMLINSDQEWGSRQAL